MPVVTLKWICFLISAILLAVAAFGIDAHGVSIVLLAAFFFVLGFGVVPGPVAVTK